MGLDITLGKVCKPIPDKEIFNTLNYPCFEIYKSLAKEVCKEMIYSKEVGKWFETSNIQMTKKGKFYLSSNLGISFDYDQYLPIQKTFYEFSISEDFYSSHWFADKNLKPTIDFPFVWEREKVLELAKSLNEDYKDFLPFLENFDQGTHLIFLGY